MNEKEIIKEHYSKIGKKRWDNIDSATRSEHMSKLGEKGRKSRWDKTTPEQRSKFVKNILLKGLKAHRKSLKISKVKVSVLNKKDA